MLSTFYYTLNFVICQVFLKRSLKKYRLLKEEIALKVTQGFLPRQKRGSLEATNHSRVELCFCVTAKDLLFQNYIIPLPVK
jgi:hypothetical protein